MEYRHDAAKGWLSTEITQWRRTFFNIAAKRTLKTLSLPFEVTSGGMQRNPWLPYEKSHQKCSTWCSMRILACRIVHIEDVAIYGWESPGDSSLWTALVSLSFVRRTKRRAFLFKTAPPGLWDSQYLPPISSCVTLGCVMAPVLKAVAVDSKRSGGIPLVLICSHSGRLVAGGDTKGAAVVQTH